MGDSKRKEKEEEGGMEYLQQSARGTLEHRVKKAFVESLTRFWKEQNWEEREAEEREKRRLWEESERKKRESGEGRDNGRARFPIPFEPSAWLAGALISLAYMRGEANGEAKAKHEMEE
jgi:hypothetical protein